MQKAALAMPRSALLAAAMLAAMPVAGAQPATAADARPQTMPTRDVDITYQMQAPGPDGKPVMLQQRQRWDARDGLMRLDPPSPGIYTVMNFPQHALTIVRVNDRVVIVMHTGSASMAPGVSRLAQFTRGGNEMVAGLACTDWQTTDTAGQPSIVCLTDDGVLLQAKQGDRVLVQAVHVEYAAQNPSLFAAPAGYRDMSPPQ